MISARVAADQTSTFPRFLDLAYPNIERGDGVWLFTTTGEKILDACSGGAMVSTLGHGALEIIDAGARQAEKIAYFYMDHFTNEPQEALAERLIAVAPEMARVRFASSGSEANETALRLARAYHVDRGEASRWRVISPAQAYHGSTIATLALNRPGHRDDRQRAGRRIRADQRRPLPAARLRCGRQGLALFRPGSHLGWGADLLRNRPGGAGRACRPRARGPRARARSAPARRPAVRARRQPARRRGPWPRLPAGGRPRGSA